MPTDLTIVDGADVGAWIAPRLEGGFGGKVKQQVPNGYDAYVRVLHRATDSEGNPVTWAEVAQTLGRTAHRQMQWHKLVGSDNPPQMTGPEWPGGDPPMGELDPETLKALCGILAIHTQDPQQCFFGLSTIYADVEENYSDAVQLRWPDRDFVVFSGPLSAVDQVGYEPRSGGWVTFVPSAEPEPTPSDAVRWWSQAPNLIWPANRSWFVASEYDFDSTLVGGSRALVDSILAAPELEAWEVERDDSLEAQADDLN